jgi:hypothetical protein
MSEGILERIETKLDALIALSGSGGGSALPKAEPKPTASKGKAKVTHDELTALVQPLVQDEDTKAQVKAVLTKYGLKRLGDAKEEQYEALKADFEAITADGGGDDDDGLI